MNNISLNYNISDIPWNPTRLAFLKAPSTHFYLTRMTITNAPLDFLPFTQSNQSCSIKISIPCSKVYDTETVMDGHHSISPQSSHIISAYHITDTSNYSYNYISSQNGTKDYTIKLGSSSRPHTSLTFKSSGLWLKQSTPIFSTNSGDKTVSCTFYLPSELPSEVISGTPLGTYYKGSIGPLETALFVESVEYYIFAPDGFIISKGQLSFETYLGDRNVNYLTDERVNPSLALSNSKTVSVYDCYPYELHNQNSNLGPLTPDTSLVKPLNTSSYTQSVKFSRYHNGLVVQALIDQTGTISVIMALVPQLFHIHLRWKSGKVELYSEVGSTKRLHSSFPQLISGVFFLGFYFTPVRDGLLINYFFLSADGASYSSNYEEITYSAFGTNFDLNLITSGSRSPVFQVSYGNIVNATSFALPFAISDVTKDNLLENLSVQPQICFNSNPSEGYDLTLRHQLETIFDHFELLMTKPNIYYQTPGVQIPGLISSLTGYLTNRVTPRYPYSISDNIETQPISLNDLTFNFLQLQNTATTTTNDLTSLILAYGGFSASKTLNKLDSEFSKIYAFLNTVGLEVNAIKDSLATISTLKPRFQSSVINMFPYDLYNPHWYLYNEEYYLPFDLSPETEPIKIFDEEVHISPNLSLRFFFTTNPPDFSEFSHVVIIDPKQSKFQSLSYDFFSSLLDPEGFNFLHTRFSLFGIDLILFNNLSGILLGTAHVVYCSNVDLGFL